jgi:hypothetical protein
LTSHHPSEILAPFGQRRLVNVRPVAVLALGLDDKIDMRVLRVNMECQGLPMVESYFSPDLREYCDAPLQCRCALRIW